MAIRILAILLFGSLTHAQDQYIRNFQATKSSTQITFSWEIVDGYYSSSNINYFHLLYQHRSSTSTLYISYSSASGYSRYFSYTSPLVTFPNGPYIMWVRAYRPSLEPQYTYSEKMYVKIDEVDTVLELKVHFPEPRPTCSDFLGSSIASQTSSEVLWILYESCECNLPYDLSLQDGYFTCTLSDYIIFRAKLSTKDLSTDLESLKVGLNNSLTRQDRETRIIINEVRYIISPGPCGLTVPHLNSPHCFNDTLDFENKTVMPTAQAAVSTPSPPQDYTAVTTIVAVMCATMLILVLSGFVVFLVIGLRKMNHRRASTADAKAAHDSETAAEGRSRNNPLPRGNDHVYTNDGVPVERNPSYVVMQYN